MRRPHRRTLVVGLAVVMLLVLIGVGIWAATGGITEPAVVDVSTEWGQISDKTAKIAVKVRIDNPNPVGVPPIARIDYTVAMNQITVAADRTRPIGLTPGNNVVSFAVAIQNDRIADWWVTHINRQERSTFRLTPRIVGPFGLGLDLPPEEQSVETAFLESFGLDESRTVEVDGDPFLRLTPGTATWGQATSTETPMELSVAVTNLHSESIVIDGFAYTVRMNDVTIGGGRNLDRLSVKPDETEAHSISIVLDTAKIPTWWVSHLRRGEQTDLTVAISALAESADGKLVAVDLVNQSATIHTDILGTGEATVAGEITEPTLDILPPTVEGQRMRWGEVTDETTEIETVIDFQNPNPDSPMEDLLTIVLEREVVINEVTVAETTNTFNGLGSGSGQLEFGTPLDNSKVPSWWARHLNRGESSTMTIRSAGHADVNFTRFPVDVPTRQRSFSTDLLAGLTRQSATPITIEERRVLTMETATASWGTATPEVAPVDYTARLRNDADGEVTLSEITYLVSINGIVLADAVADGVWTIRAGETATIELTMALDNSKMDQWWVTHLRNDEHSTLSFSIVGTVEGAGLEARVPIATSNETITTDLLGTD